MKMKEFKYKGKTYYYKLDLQMPLRKNSSVPGIDFPLEFYDEYGDVYTHNSPKPICCCRTRICYFESVSKLSRPENLDILIEAFENAAKDGDIEI